MLCRTKTSSHLKNVTKKFKRAFRIKLSPGNGKQIATLELEEPTELPEYKELVDSVQYLEVTL